MKKDNNDEVSPNHHEKQDDIAKALQKVIPSTPLTHSKHARENRNVRRNSALIGSRKVHDESKIREAHVSSKNIGVTCMVTLRIARVAIGACSDSLFRFWDLETAKVICSCATGLQLKTIKDGGANVTISDDAQLSCLVLSSGEDMLMGGYESGEIRIWIVSIPSINNIRISQAQVISGMAVPPIQLLNEWTVHESSVQSIEVIHLEEEDWGSHESYLVTSGQDQSVHMWTISGEHVGTFGGSKGWDLDEKSTWKARESFFDSISFFGSSKPSDPAPSKSRRKHWRKGNQTIKYKIDPNDAGTNHFRMAKLRNHMEKIKFKNQKKLIDPSTTEVHAEMINAALSRNPMVTVSEAHDMSHPSPTNSGRSKSASSTRPISKRVSFHSKY